jgi:methylated-DNA-[protein]-cysteine S-methyltransferase
MIYDIIETAWAGRLILAGDENGLRHLNFIDGKHPVAIEKAWRHDPDPFATIRTQLADFLAGERKRFDVTLFPQGTPFQRKVWSALLEIPYGNVVSYQWMARRIGNPGAARAVGAANGRNPIAIMIPCHRVISQQGKLTGYGGGIDVKRRLIRLERSGVLLDQNMDGIRGF